MLRVIFCLLSLVLCVACSDQKPGSLRIGVTQGPHTDIAQFVASLAKDKGLDVEIVSFDDFVKPNEALQAGNVHMNIYQHEPFLTHQMHEHAYDFETRGKSVLMPLGLYGNAHITRIDDIPDNAKALIPVDPTNNARALLLLERAGLLTLTTHKNPTRKDIQDNPKNLHIIQVEAPLIPRLLADDGDIAVIHSDWVMVADMDPAQALMMEDPDSSAFDNVMVVRRGEHTDILEKIDRFIKLYHSDKTADFMASRYKGAIVPAWAVH